MATAAASGPILPTSGTTDPDILDTIAFVPAGAEPAVILPAAADPTTPPEAPVEGVAGKPRFFTRRQYAQAIAAIKRIATAPTSDITTQGVVQSVLDAHNMYRARHQVPPLSWDNTIEAAAVNWASKCQFQNEPNSPYGENLFWTSAQNATGALNAATKAW